MWKAAGAPKANGLDMSATPSCPLCQAESTQCYHVDGDRQYFRCSICEMIFLHPAHRISLAAEQSRYREHRNDAADAGYVRFLRRLADPMVRRLPPGARGLDFGAGPAPVLAALLTSEGFPCKAHDPLFMPDDRLLSERYDFVTCSEVVEHLHDPAAGFALMAELLTEGGLLGVMTRFYGHEAPFSHWWYRRDPTHVCFYAEPTMRWIAEDRGWSVELPRPHVALFTVPKG